MSISIVAGLGNPGRDYADTRHNYGWIVLDALARRHGLSWSEHKRFEAEVARWDKAPGRTLWLVKPLTYMNDSGRSLGALLHFHKVEPSQTAVVFDDLTLDLGLLKVSNRGSSGGHNGVASVIEHLGENFVRYRLGIGPKQPPQMDLKDFVLGKFTPDQLNTVTQNLENTLKGLELLLESGITRAMNQLNRRQST
jgi:peptidyl-tRNA hydrolase, PTH1 family